MNPVYIGCRYVYRARGYFPSPRDRSLLGRYTNWGERNRGVKVSCARSLRNDAQPGLEPASCESQVRSSADSATESSSYGLIRLRAPTRRSAVRILTLRIWGFRPPLTHVTDPIQSLSEVACRYNSPVTTNHSAIDIGIIYHMSIIMAMITIDSRVSNEKKLCLH